MKLTSEQEVLELLSLKTTTQSVQALGVALETATSIAEAILGTDFTRKTRLDRFLVDREHYDRLRDGHTVQFLLEDGYLPDARGKVYASSARLLVTSTATVVDRSTYLIDKDKGVLILTGLALTGLRSLGVRYECGFKEDSDGIAEGVPQWLKSAVISACIEVLRSHVYTHNKKDDLVDMSNQLTRTLRTLLYQKIRPRYAGVFPLISEVV